VTQIEVFQEILGRLRELGIAYALTGSYASTYWGEPRSTHDIDLVVMVTADQAAALAEAAGSAYYADPEMAREAPGHTNHFNFIHLETGLKIDFWVVGPSAYDRESFARRLAPEEGRPLLVVLAPEDVILSKLLWTRAGGGERHWHDIRGIIRMRGARLDLQYLRDWAARLDLSEEVEALLGAGPHDDEGPGEPGPR
jgi:hypothetical protein